MRKIYLVRHGKREGEGRFIGITDVPLNNAGRKEAAILSGFFNDLAAKKGTMPLIFTSPLVRSRETAEIIAGGLPGVKLKEVPMLHEVDLGEWEGRSLEEIKRSYPEEFEERDRVIGTFKIPGGENFLEGGERFKKAVFDIREGTEKDRDIIIVAHAGVIRAFLSILKNRDINAIREIPLPYTSVTTLSDTGEETLVESVGIRPLSMLDSEEIGELYKKYQVPENVIRHMKKVCETALEIYEGIPEKNKLNKERIEKACLLHDLLRSEPHHETASAEAVIKEGYPEVAELIRMHHSPDFSPEDRNLSISEEELLFYADKVTLEDRKVSLEERFSKSREKCLTKEALEKHSALYEKAKMIRDKV